MDRLFKKGKQTVSVHGFTERCRMKGYPFHAGKSLRKQDGGYYHCFGCDATGSGINFVVRLFGLGIRQTVEKVAVDLGRRYVRRLPRSPPDNDKSSYIRILNGWDVRKFVQQSIRLKQKIQTAQERE